MARRNHGRQNVPRRMTDWVAAGAVPTALVSVPDTMSRVVLAQTLTEGSPAIGTVVRIRGGIHLEIAGETTVPMLSIFGVGIGLFDDRAFAVADAVGLPRPLDDADDEKWMWYHTGYLGMGPAISDANVFEISASIGRKTSVDLVVDSKAMRKWDENQTLAWVVEAQNIDGTPTEIDVAAYGRMLIKLA